MYLSYIATIFHLKNLIDETFVNYVRSFQFIWIPFPNEKF